MNLEERKKKYDSANPREAIVFSANLFNKTWTVKHATPLQFSSSGSDYIRF